MPGKQIRTGDAIGAFYYRNDSLVCAGWGTWDPVLGCVFTVWGDDDRTPLKDGFVTNEPLMIKVYDSRYKRVWDADVVTVSTGSLTFTPNGITKIDSLIAKKFNSMRCIIRAGWNLISANVVPRWPEVETIFKSSVATNSLTLVKDEDGLVYWPQIGLNQLITWDITKAYWAYFYTNGTSDTLYMKGANIDIAKNSIPLRAGWNLLPYWGTRAVSVVTALADLAVSNPDMLVKDQSGNIYWPSVGFNSIGSMNIGQGYELYLTTAVPRFQYPSTVASYSIKSFNTGRGIPEVADLSYGEVSKYNAKFSPVSQVLGLEINGYAMKQGDEIGIFTKDGLCVGSAKYNKSNTNVVAITVFGDMPMSEKDAKIGAVEGDVLTIKLFCKADGKEYTPVVNSVNWKVGSVSGLSYKTNTIGAVKITVKGASSSALPTEFAIQQNYPNPFNPTTNIKYALPVDGLVKIKVYDMLGREIKTLVNTQQPAGYYTIEWDATNNMGRKVASGVYFYQIEASNFNKTVKMMLMK
jgi:hypothetical protein